MRVNTYSHGLRLFGIVLAAMSVFTFGGNARAQNEPTGTVQQGLVAPRVVSAADQEKYTLVSLSVGCSGSLLRNNWVITAAHCVEADDPNKPGTIIMTPDNGVTVTANWKDVQVRQSIRIITFRPNDVAIIRVDKPFTVGGSNTKFIRDIFRDGQFPYFGQLAPVPIKAFGRGINQFATGSGATAMPSSSDNQFRLGLFMTDREEANLYWYPSTAGQHIAGGDSGGPSFATVRGTDEVLMGVHARCNTKCMGGMTCGRWPGPGPAPPNYSNWMWVIDTPACADAPIAPVWDDINRYLGAFTPGEDSGTEPPLLGPIAPPGPTIVPAFIYGIGPDGRLQWYRHDGARAGTGLETPGAWQGARPVGVRWDGLKHVFPGGGNIIYAITPDGTLKWYQHKGFNTGLGLESAGSWEGAKDVGRGWESFKHVFSGGDGIIYAITPDGRLWWYHHIAYRTGGGLNEPGAWEGRTVVGRGWESFTHVFSTGGGYIYAISPDGRLWWYHHKAYMTGGTLETPGAWEGRTVVGRGWESFTHVFSAGDGLIYAVMSDGRLWWYRHNAYRTGGVLDEPGAWTGRTVIGRGWGDFTEVFALLPATPDIVR